MNKILCTITALLLSNAVYADSYASCFSGWDITVGVGYSNIMEQTSVDDTAISFTNSLDYGAGSVAVQGQIGWNCAFRNDWVLGIGVYAQYNNAEIKHDYANSDFSGSNTVKDPLNLGVAFRGGYAYCQNQLLYVGIGPDWMNRELRVTSGRHGTHDYNSWRIAPRLLGGAEQRVCGKLILKEEFAYAWYESKTKAFTSGSNSLSITDRPRIATFMFSAGYLF